MRNNEQAPLRTVPEEEPAFLAARGVIGIRNADGMGITERGSGFEQVDAVLADVGQSLR